jgi:hypothetical protein
VKRDVTVSGGCGQEPRDGAVRPCVSPLRQAPRFQEFACWHIAQIISCGIVGGESRLQPPLQAARTFHNCGVGRSVRERLERLFHVGDPESIEARSTPVLFLRTEACRRAAP